MFSNLIESGSHRRDLARRGRFFLGTLALYGALLALAGVASIYAFNARLGEQTYTITLLPPYTPPAAEAPPDAPHPAAPASGGDRSELPQRAAPILDLNTVTSELPPVSTAPSKLKPLVPGAIITGRDVDVSGVGVGPTSPGPVGGTSAGVAVRVPVGEVEDPRPPEVAPMPTPTPLDKLRVTSQVLSGKTISKPAPPYPPLAITTRTEGTVAVEILIDEQGKVISATATSGPPMLRAAAQNAALQARFTPTFLNGRPVKVSGVITYNFKLQ